LKGPRLFLNSIPKSGTHMLQQIIMGIPSIQLNADGQFYEGYPQQLPDHKRRLSLMKPYEFGAGHVYYSKEWSNMIRSLGHKHIFISRDPRDIVVSFAYFITEKYPQHELHPYFTNHLKTQKQRYLALIQGVNHPTIQYPNINDWYRRFIGWRSVPGTLHITYEQLMTSMPSRYHTLKRISSYVWSDSTPPISQAQMIHRMNINIDPKKSVTFRKGKIGNWRNEFDSETKEIFKQIAGKLLIELGYEKGYRW
jgi:hypothetical protein